MDYDFLNVWQTVCDNLGLDWQDELQEARNEVQSILDTSKPYQSLMEIEEFLLYTYGLESDYIDQFIY